MLKVRDVMTRSVVSVQLVTPLKEVAIALVDNRISGVPVLDVDGTVLGVVSEADLLIKEQGSDAIRHRTRARIPWTSRESRAQLDKLEAVTAHGAMTTPAITIESHRRIAEAAALMTARKVNRLPVLDAGRLVGIVSRGDLIRAYVRSDDDLARTIREEVLLRILWLNPSLFTVTVTDGVVRIRGWVERRSTAEAIESSIGMVPGVVDVHVDVGWQLDDSRAAAPLMDPVSAYGPR